MADIVIQVCGHNRKLQVTAKYHQNWTLVSVHTALLFPVVLNRTRLEQIAAIEDSFQPIHSEQESAARTKIYLLSHFSLDSF